VIKIHVDSYTEFKDKINANMLKHYCSTSQGRILLVATDGPFYYTHSLQNINKDDYDENLSSTCNPRFGDEVVLSPFSFKCNFMFCGQGVKNIITASSTGNIEFTVLPGIYNFNAVEILNGNYGDVVQLRVMDDALGTYTTVPNMILNQFGTNWNMRQELIKDLPYPAKLQEGMIIRVVYTNNSLADREIYFNLDLHKIG